MTLQQTEETLGGLRSSLREAWLLGEVIPPTGDTLRATPIDVPPPERRVLAGRDAEGRFHVLIAREGAADEHEDRASAGVQIWVTNRDDGGVPRAFIDVVCLIPELVRLFEDIVADMLERISLDGGDPALICASELNRWRSLLERPRSDRLSLSEEIGLYGELLVALDVARFDPRAIPSNWTGAHNGTVDFVSETAALEVKTTTRREGRVVKIHGVEQLDPPGGRDLFLEFIRVVESPEGASVADLVVQLTDLGVRRLEMLQSLGKRGYEERMAAGGELRSFEVVERFLYRVDSGFPRIVRSSFVGSRMPIGTLMLRYQIDLTGASPSPLADDAARRVYERLT